MIKKRYSPEWGTRLCYLVLVSCLVLCCSCLLLGFGTRLVRSRFPSQGLNLGPWSPNHWTARKFPNSVSFNSDSWAPLLTLFISFVLWNNLFFGFKSGLRQGLLVYKASIVQISQFFCYLQVKQQSLYLIILWCVCGSSCMFCRNWGFDQ